MLVAIKTTDKPGALQIRLDTRTAHLDYIKETGIVAMAGPVLDDEEQMCGSLIVLDVDTVAQAQNWADNDPYAKAGLFADVSVRQWKKVIG